MRSVKTIAVNTFREAIRNRIMSLADRTIQGNPDIYRLFAYRLDKNKQDTELKSELATMVEGRHELVSVIPDPMRKIIRNYLKFFYAKFCRIQFHFIFIEIIF